MAMTGTGETRPVAVRTTLTDPPAVLTLLVPSSFDPTQRRSFAHAETHLPPHARCRARHTFDRVRDVERPTGWRPPPHPHRRPALYAAGRRARESRSHPRGHRRRWL